MFLYGGVGVGKNHLAQSVAKKILEADKNKKIYFCPGDNFTNELIESIREKSTPRFRRKYRYLSLLIVDDIQFIAGKNAVQEEFFHTFNSIASAGGQIILTSDRPPAAIKNLEDRLLSRFLGGLTVDIQVPDFELRSAIVQIKAEERGIKIDSEIVQLIAGNIDSARAIQGFIVNLFTQVNFKKLELTYDAVQSILGKGNEKNERVIKSNPEDVINIVSKYYSVGKKQLLGESRARPIARPRQMLMYLLKTQLGIPYQEVGRLIGGRDHTTVMHAVNKIQELASSSVDIQEDIRGIKKSL